MRNLFILPALVAAVLALSGCAVPDMVAHIAKSAQSGNRGSGQAAAQPVQQPQAQPQVDPYEAPPPVAARQEAIQTESLPPPK